MSEAGLITTVTGDMRAEGPGVVLPHEHLIHRVSVHSGNPDNTCTDIDMVVSELAAFTEQGGRIICDVTPHYFGRDPVALREVSERSGVAVVTGVGLYPPDTFTQELRGLSRTQMSDFLLRQVEGNGTGICCGMIGEIGSHEEPDHADWRRYRLWESEVVVYRAVADVQRGTGLAVTNHAVCGRGGMAQIRTMVDAGADPERIIISHCDAQWHDDIKLDLDYYLAVINEGAAAEFDLFGWTELMPDECRYDRVAALVSEGHAERVLLSTDTCRLSQLHGYGGRGFDHLFKVVIPALRDRGVGDDAIHQMTVANPTRLLARR